MPSRKVSTEHRTVIVRPQFNHAAGFTVWFVFGLLAAWIAAAETDVTPAPSTNGMLLLWSGRTVEGRIVKNGDSFSVIRSTGEMFVPAVQVRLQCRDLKDAYRQLREKVPTENSAEEHLSLARWCLTQQLFPEARQELHETLSANPDHREARELLKKFEAAQSAPPAAEKSRKPERTTPAVTQDFSQPTNWREFAVIKQTGFSASDVESLGGLSHETAQTFMRRIQPILMNNCALAGCHSTGATNEFQLQRVTGGSDVSRSLVERNLSVVLRYVSAPDARSSPLLSIPSAKHGRPGRMPFAGVSGKEQSEELRRWVLAVAKERGPAGTATGAKKTSVPVVPAGESRTANTVDPFDPTEFNRKSTGK